MLRNIFAMAGALLAMLFVGGCSTNPRFETETPTTKITGEAVCEVPQHWKALALEGVNTETLSQATVVQVRIPAEWIGDALGWFVENAVDSRVLDHIPRMTWRAYVVDARTGKGQLFPAIMKNPLRSPYLTVLITDPAIAAGQELHVYVLSGAYTKLLTVTGDRLLVPNTRNCLDGINAEFVRSFPSKAVAERASQLLLEGIFTDFPKPGLHSDGRVYSVSRMALSPEVVGDTRRVTRRERTANRGAVIAVDPTILIGNPAAVVPLGASLLYSLSAHVLSQGGEYTGPFGERQYSLPQVKAALTRMVKELNRTKREIEMRKGYPYSKDFSFHLDFDGSKSGWEIGEHLALQVEAAWAIHDRLEGRVSNRHN